MKRFKKDLFNEILGGLKEVCGDAAALQQLLSAATEIYIASESDEVKEGKWIITTEMEHMVKCSRVAECPFCKTRRAIFVADTLNFCNGCGARLARK